MESYSMRDNFDCGIAAMSFTTNEDYDKLKQIWGWQNKNDIRDNLIDSPYHHDNVLSKLGIKHITVDANNIMDGKCLNNKTMILLHFSKEPEVRNFLSFLSQELQATLKQHWVVLHTVGNGFVSVHWGNGSQHCIPFQTFKKMYTAGFPNCAYEIGRGNTRIPWYVRLYAKITGRFYSCIS